MSCVDGDGSDGEDGSDKEEDGVERDPLKAMVAAFQAEEYHTLPLEMKVQALEYLVDRAMEVRDVAVRRHFLDK